MDVYREIGANAFERRKQEADLTVGSNVCFGLPRDLNVVIDIRTVEKPL